MKKLMLIVVVVAVAVAAVYADGRGVEGYNCQVEGAIEGGRQQKNNENIGKTFLVSNTGAVTGLAVSGLDTSGRAEILLNDSTGYSVVFRQETDFLLDIRSGGSFIFLSDISSRALFGKCQE